ncbi:MAG: Menaquinone reductase, iron-sulfur cluster-binding subunit [Verrucomicrobia subdivision 3 bacterium]|nr:Menaquinone reductase, iron-sulfur cluster-binding subunit [Limisphaerales bacterium]MCS1416203.1 Menaquinone reductase, iron-sulfur cluster-binding subunit [Limisphaerales bacterium]
MTANSSDKHPTPRPPRRIGRRTFLKGTGATMVGIAGLVTALKPLLSLERGEITLSDLLQKHYQELGPEDMQRILHSLERKTQKDYGVTSTISDTKPQEGIEFAYALSLSKCVGCRRCAHACMAENNQSRDAADDIEMSYIRVLELDKGAINLEASDQYYEGEVPQKGKYYMPVQCHQCKDSPCTKACPVEATWMEPDGVVVVDYNWCIGCRYCMAACPYDARRFNWKKPTISPEAINPNQGYLSNRLRPQGVVEKCTFCLHRTREGKYPACLEVCPTGARVFGNLLDPDSEINYILQNKRVYILKEDAGTVPRFYYFFD